MNRLHCRTDQIGRLYFDLTNSVPCPWDEQNDSLEFGIL